jgi:5-formyltetrahydrofolate cyclo-ligase
MGTEKKVFRERLRADSFNEGLLGLNAALGGERACEQLLTLGAWKQADAIFSFVSVSGELGTKALNQAVWERGKVLALPRIGPSGRMEFYRLDDHQSLESQLKPNQWKILEPDAKPSMLARARDFSHPLFIVPGLAFSSGGERLGRGGGFYDRYLANEELPPMCVGWCFDEQILDYVPQESQDMRMNFLVTPTSCLSFSGY